VADKAGARKLYHALRTAFSRLPRGYPLADRRRRSRDGTYHGTHKGTFLGVAPTGRKIHFDTVDAMRVHDGKITEHWGVANLFSLMQQLGALPPDKKALGTATKRYDDFCRARCPVSQVSGRVRGQREVSRRRV
jgi:hypothetical protein